VSHFSHQIYGTSCTLNKVSNYVRYLSIWLQSPDYIVASTSSFPSPFATNSSYPFHISFKPPFATQFSRHIMFNVFDQSFHISAVFQNALLICFVCRVTYELFNWNCIKIVNNTPTSKRSLSGHVKCQHAIWIHKYLSTGKQK